MQENPNPFSEAVTREAAAEQARDCTARALHHRTTVVLGYCNIPLRVTHEGVDASPVLGGAGGLRQQTLERLLLGGVNVLVWSPGTPTWMPSGRGLGGRAKVDFYLEQLDAVHELERLTGGLMQVARSTADIRRINAEGAIAILLHLSGANHLNDMGVLQAYYDRGVRIIHAGFQDWPEHDPPDEITYDGDPNDRIYHAGRLNEHGVRTIERMNELGMVVDVAHIRPEGFDDVAELMAGRPFIYSHGACASLAPGHWRNLDDARIERIAQSGGVYGIGVYLLSANLSGPVPESDDAVRANDDKLAEIARLRREREAKLEREATGVRDYIVRRLGPEHWGNWEIHQLARHGAWMAKPSTTASVVAHMEHLRHRFGAGVVGYGPDYEFTYGFVRGIEEPDKTPNLTRALLDAQWPEQHVQAAMGHNFMRVFEQVIG